MKGDLRQTRSRPAITLRRIPFDDMESAFKWGRPTHNMRLICAYRQQVCGTNGHRWAQWSQGGRH